MGYDQNQVDRYLQKLTDEYESLQQQVADLSDERDRLMRQPQSRAQAGEAGKEISMEAISKALVDAEVKAIQVVADAKAEAARIIENAQSDVKKIHQEKSRAAAEVVAITERLKNLISASGFDSANTRANAQAKEN